ncbi:unnamed protein product [Prunus armeniaca]
MDKESATLPNGGSLSRKVVAVAAGEAHTLALTGDGFVYSWGRGMFGRLGTGAEADELFPVRIKFNDPRSAEERRLKLVGVAAGSYHSLALAGFLSFLSIFVYTLFPSFLKQVKLVSLLEDPLDG